jgi:hypothetical protein
MNAAPVPLPGGYVGELTRIHMTATTRSAFQAKLTKRYRILFYGLSIPAAVAGTVAGSTALAQSAHTLTIVAAFTAAALSALIGVIKPEQGRINHAKQAASYGQLASDARAEELRLGSLAAQDRETMLAALNQRLYELESTNTD